MNMNSNSNADGNNDIFNIDRSPERLIEEEINMNSGNEDSSTNYDDEDVGSFLSFFNPLPQIRDIISTYIRGGNCHLSTVFFYVGKVPRITGRNMVDGEEKLEYLDDTPTITEADLHALAVNLSFKSDTGRAGLEGNLHRISRAPPSEEDWETKPNILAFR